MNIIYWFRSVLLYLEYGVKTKLGYIFMSGEPVHFFKCFRKKHFCHREKKQLVASLAEFGEIPSCHAINRYTVYLCLKRASRYTSHAQTKLPVSRYLFTSDPLNCHNHICNTSMSKKAVRYVDFLPFWYIKNSKLQLN